MPLINTRYIIRSCTGAVLHISTTPVVLRRITCECCGDSTTRQEVFNYVVGDVEAPIEWEYANPATAGLSFSQIKAVDRCIAGLAAAGVRRTIYIVPENYNFVGIRSLNLSME